MPKRRETTSVLYDSDLARIHVEGYGFHWEGAAASLLGWLDEYGVAPGETVIDLGCGGGQWVRELTERGYKACGIDISESMIRLARERAARAKFVRGSFDEVDIPSCAAVTSLGEPLNYLDGGSAMRRTMRNVFAALSPGGVFVFDVRHPARGRSVVQHHQKQTGDWFCYARIEEDPRTNRLTRHITTFRRQPDGAYRRGEETHRLRLYARSEMLAWLRAIGFRVRTRRGYGDYRLGPRQSVFVCRKPMTGSET